MRAVIYTRTGDTSVLQVVERPLGEPGEGEGRVGVVVSGVNPTDWKSRGGAFGRSPAEPTVPNHDGAGIVDVVGPGVTGIEAGDRVWVTLAGDSRPASGTAQVRGGVGDRALDPSRRRGGGADAARVGEQRSDDVLLLRARSRGAARVRPRRLSRAAALCAADAGVDRRYGRRCGDLPGVQPRRLVGGGGGRRDVHRRGALPGALVAVLPAGAPPPAG